VVATAWDPAAAVIGAAVIRRHRIGGRPRRGQRRRFRTVRAAAAGIADAPQARRILSASLIGTTIEFFDFYIYFGFLFHTGTSLTFNLAGILGASLAPSIATLLATHYGVAYMGYYLSGAGLVSLAALLMNNTGKAPARRSLSMRRKRSQKSARWGSPS